MDWNEFLHEAVAEKDADLVRQALTEGADSNRLDPSNGFRAGTTELYWAVSGGELEIVRLLLDAGARVAAEAQAESSSLHAAVEDVNLPIVSLLLDYDGHLALDWFDYVDRTPLMVAVEAEHMALAGRLVDAGANVNAHNEPRIGDTALHIAAANGTLEMVEMLLAAGADPTIPGWMARTARDKARGRKRGDGPRIYDVLERAARRFQR